MSDQATGRRRKLRLRTVIAKCIYVVASILVVYLVSGILHVAPYPVVDVVVDVLGVAAWVVAVRSFRGKNEDFEAPRSWWRLTARATAGYVLGAVFFVLAALAIVAVLSGRASLTNVVGVDLAAVPVYIFFAAAYLHSSVRLDSRKMRPESQSN